MAFAATNKYTSNAAAAYRRPSVGTFNSTFPPPLGMYVTFGLFDSDCTIALLASIFRSATNASPALFNACEIVAAASASPSARITAAWRSCSA